MRIPTFLFILLLAGVLVGCGSSGSQVRLRMELNGEPVRGAATRVITLGTNGIPLPVSIESLGDARRSALPRSVWTDGVGEIEIPLAAGERVLIEALESPTAAELGASPRLWRWSVRWEDGRPIMVPIDGEGPQPTLVVRPR